MSKQNHTLLKYRPDIDGLRAISVIGVLLFHLKVSGFSGGFFGVDVFFVLSGYLISSLLVKELQENGKISFINFYARRFRRLIPGIISTLLITLVVWTIFFFKLEKETESLLSSMRYGVAGLANIFFRKNTGNYFDASTDEMPLLHFWSLGVEEQFFIIWPLLIIAIYKLSKANNFLKNLLIVFLTLSLISFGDSIRHIYNGNQSRVFYSVLFRAWELGLGAMLAAVLFSRKNTLSAGFVIRNIVATLGIISIFSSFYFFEKNSYVPGWRALFPTLGTLSLLIFLNEKVWFYRFLTLKPLVSMGKVSYGIYLYHWPIYSLLYLYSLDNKISNLEKAAVVLLTFFISYLSYYLWEMPIHKAKWGRGFSSRKVVGVGLFTIFFMFSLLTGYSYLHKNYLKKDELSSYYSQLNERANYPKDCYGSVTNYDYKNCYLIKKSNSKKNLIFMWGDSITWANANLFDEFSQNLDDFSMVAYANFGHAFRIPPLFGVENIQNSKRNKKTARTLNLSVRNNLKKMTEEFKSTSIVISAYWFGHFQEIKSSYPKNYQNLFKKYVDETIAELMNLGVSKVLILSDYPSFDFNITQCTLVHGREKCFLETKKFNQSRKEVSSILSEAISKNSRVKHIRVIDYMCPNEKCFTEVSDNGVNIPLVWDNFHPSSSASRLLARKIDEELKWLTSN